MKIKNTDPRIAPVVTKSLQKVSSNGGYNSTHLPFPASATTRTRNKISTEAKAFHDLLVSTRVLFCDEDIYRSYDITQVSGAFGMLINDREFGVYQTAPQCTAAARIISAIAKQASCARKAIKFSPIKSASFELVLDAMDKIANAIGPLADYRRFQMDADMAAAVILENYDRVDELFDATGNCNKELLLSQIARFSVVRGEGRIQSIEVITDAKPAHIAAAVRRSAFFDFSVGSAPIRDPRFMDSLVKHLEQQRQNAMLVH